MSGWNRSGIGRRRFVQLMGWAGAAAVAQGGPALAAAAQKSKASARPPVPPPTPAPTADAAPGISQEARALAGVVKERYGEFITPPDLEIITRDLDGDVRGIQRLRSVKLANADEPDVTFKA